MEAHHELRDAARRLRRKMSLPEVLLWKELRGGKVGLHFRRQHPIGPYVLDFYCDAAKLAVEVDGYSHGTDDRPEQDARRDAWLADKGIRTLRVSARSVLHSPHDIALGIRAYADENAAPRCSLRGISREAGEGASAQKVRPIPDPSF